MKKCEPIFLLTLLCTALKVILNLLCTWDLLLHSLSVFVFKTLFHKGSLLVPQDDTERNVVKLLHIKFQHTGKFPVTKCFIVSWKSLSTLSLLTPQWKILTRSWTTHLYVLCSRCHKIIYHAATCSWVQTLTLG